MKKTLLIALTAFTFFQCAKKETPYLIQKGKIGLLQKNFNLKQIDSLFAKDSLVNIATDDAFTGNINDIEVFEKGGKHLLSLSPNDDKTINIVTVHDVRYQTKEGVNNNSTFKDFRLHYEVSKINRIMNNLNIEFKNQEFYVTIDINQLPSEYQFDYDAIIEAVSIPDTAKIKSFQLDWF